MHVLNLQSLGTAAIQSTFITSLMAGCHMPSAYIFISRVGGRQKDGAWPDIIVHGDSMTSRFDAI
jgi:hypothetical protein